MKMLESSSTKKGNTDDPQTASVVWIKGKLLDFTVRIAHPSTPPSSPSPFSTAAVGLGVADKSTEVE